GAVGLPAPLPSPAGEAYCLDASAVPPELRDRLAGLPGVERVVETTVPYQLASRALHPEKTTIRVGAALLGGPDPVVIAGPCSVEDEDQIRAAARAAREAGAQILRGGAFKPRTSPYSFQGLGERGLELLACAGREAGLPVVTEVMEPDLVPLVAEHADI